MPMKLLIYKIKIIASTNRAFTKMSSWRVYAISMWGTKVLGALLPGLIFLWYPVKIVAGPAHSSQGARIRLAFAASDSADQINTSVDVITRRKAS